MSLKRLLNPDAGTDAGDARAQNRSFSQEARLESAELGPSYFPSLFESDTFLTGPSFQSHLYADNNVMPNLSTESTFSSQDGLFVPFDQSWFSQAESDNAMSIDSTPAVNSIDSTEGLNEVFNNADLGTPVVEELVCYGMFYNEKVKLVGQGEELQRRVQEIRNGGSYLPRSYTLRVQPSAELQLFLKFADNGDLGYLNEKMEGKLKDIANEPSIELDAVVNLQSLSDAIRRAQKQSDAAIRVDVNIYGPEASRDRVGKYLSDKALFLQPPNEKRREARYDNPHILQLDGLDESDTDESDSDSVAASSNASSEQNQDFQETIAEVFNSLTRSDDLRGVRGSEGLNRALYQHQEEALYFMLQRETGDIPDKYRLWRPEMVDGEQKYRHIITKAQQNELPDESGGGILADEMGMGKSLTTLVLIEKTLSDALKWAEECKTQPDDMTVKRHCRATLVIVPSHVLINMWTREVEEHLDNSLRVFKYHGKHREKHLSDIEHCDIVITTYNTLAREHGIKNNGGSQSPLHDIEWYRVVLDEAHMIRRQATTFHHAVRDLSAKSRWCLSGTPIQNSLIDLGALLVFIQAKPFHHLGIFRHWISNPFEARSTRPRAIERLALLLEGICLRRTIERVDLPGQREEIHTVEFTPAERKQYKDTNKAMQRFVIQKVGDYNDQKTFGMFQIFLQLRSLCNHGTYQRPFSWTKKMLFDDEADPVCSITRESLARCVGCREPLPLISGESRPAYAENCKHVLCQECSPVTERPSNPAMRPNCPICKSRKAMPFSFGQNSHPPSRETTDTEKDDDGYLRSNGYSSKMTMLVSDVQKDLNTTKSIIFSCWTRTLDLIGKHLSSANIEYARIDGKTPLSQRQKTLDNFDRTRNISVLIMTTGTGALGLNLKSVNRVFIIEPQWNPAVESQAIARAIRLGQTEQVLVIRYRVKASIEENMCEQQMQKLKISKMDFKKDFLTIPSSASNVDSESVSGQATPDSSSDIAM
ncbi:putative SWI/SNF-related matrix-associated actin-dependent regulator of chromatin [Talaromyces pinophilus]|nr:putative SWI/SNF-related matrix-associated actin-dependent regulator of chromatin [Talaromyces pinophilus]